MTPAQADIAAISDWLTASSRMRRTPLGKDRILVGPYATLLPVDPESTDWPDLSELAENGLALLVPTGQMPAKMPKARIDMPPHGHPALAERVRHLLANKLGVDLPDVLTVALSSPAQSVLDVLAGEGLADIDLDAVACLCVPLWVLPADLRPTVADLCKHP
jgi:hypothetical protein